MADVEANELDRRKRREFYAELDQYYRRKWNAAPKVPSISGRPVDFYVLYQKVTSLGGWSKVSVGNKWPDVVNSLNLPEGCAASEHAVKTIYMRYLSKFEQSQLFGEADAENGDGASSALGGRSARGRSYLSSLGANSHPRFASSFLTDGYSTAGTSANNIGQDGRQCERLIRCLQCGLPNEVDFALNVCLMLSSPANAGGCQFALRPYDMSRLVQLMLAHTGVFDEDDQSYRQLYTNAWMTYAPGRDYELFWHDYLEPCSDYQKLLHYDETEESAINAYESLFGCLDLTPNDMATMRKRIEQVANILRNFSFEPDFRSCLGNNRAMIRYILMAINCRNIELQCLALDILSNVACEMILDDMKPSLLRLLMNTLSRCLYSDDKFHVVRALETIGNLCCKERNEMLLCDFLEPEVLRRMIALLAVKDIMLCVYLLECLYQVTEMGQVPCQRLVEQSGAVDTLAQLVTVEAVSFGPNGLSGMKVVEYGMPTPHTAILPQPPSRTSSTTAIPHPHSAINFDRQTTPASPIIRRPMAESSTIHQSGSTAALPPQHPPPFLARPVRPVSANVVSSIDIGGKAQNLSPTPVKKEIKIKTEEAMKPTIDTSEKMPATSASQSSPNCRGPTVMVQQDQRVEELTLNWLRQNCNSDTTSHVSRGELYASYVQDMRQLHDSMALSVTAFTNFVRQVFPSCTVRQLQNANDSNDGGQNSNCRSNLLQFEGLKFSPNVAVAKNNSTSPCLSSSQVAAQHPLMQQILSSGTAQKQNSGDGIMASPTLQKVNSSTISILCARSDSVGTMDSGYSLPGTPDSLSSGFSGTNSSTGPTNFAAFQQSQINSPKTPKKPKMTNRKSPKSQEASTVPSNAVVNSNGLVNGVVECSDSTVSSSTTTSAVCQLEVCHPAQEARTVIESGDNHEARIVRVENTIAMVSSQFFVPERKPSPPPNKTVNGTVNCGDNTYTSESSNGLDLPTTPVSSTTKKKTVKKKTPQKGATTPLNGLIKTLEVGSNALVARVSSPSPDMEAMKQNVNQSIQSIQELLAGGSNDETISKPTKNETKKTGTPRKRKNASVNKDDSATDLNSEKPPPKKKKYYPKKKKGTITTVASANDLQGHLDLSNIPSVSGASSSFRQPLPPSNSHSPHLSQPTAMATPGQMVVRIPAPPVGQLKYVCEWEGCGRSFGSSSAVYYHVAKVHINDEVRICRWRHCDQTSRLRWSLVAHIQDAHCNESSLRTAAVRRYEISMCGHSNIPEPRPAPSHPGYPPDAAIVAIRRHSLVNLAKDIIDESEGPVTKSIRLTSSLILRNLARYSLDARRILKKYERTLAYVAFSRLESSAALAQCLAEMNRSSLTTTTDAQVQRIAST